MRTFPCSRLLFLISVRLISLIALHSAYSKFLASRASVFILRSSFQNEYYTDRFNEKSAMEILKDEVSSIIQSYVDSKCENPSFKVNPSDLIENSHLLSKGRIYETIIDEKLRQCDSQEKMQALKNIDTSMRSFIVSERKSRARLKLNYMLAGATSNRFELAIKMLSDSGELDDDLLTFIESLIRKEIRRSVDPVADVDEELIASSDNKALTVLRMIQRRIEAEFKIRGDENANVRLLGELLTKSNPQAREAVLMASFTSVESIRSFHAFLTEAIAHIQTTGGVGRKDSKSKEIVLSDDTSAKMRDIQYSVEMVMNILETGLKDNNVYSTSLSDYNTAPFASSSVGLEGANEAQDKPSP